MLLDENKEPILRKWIVMTESVFTTAAIDAKEGRKVAFFVLWGAVLNVRNDEKVIMFIKRKLAELIVHIAPQMY